jgi:hypothetical protein
MRGLTSAAGVMLDTSAGRADLVLGGAATSLEEAFVFPNPYKGVGPGGDEGVNFGGLPEQATIRVFTLQGIQIRKLDHHNSSGATHWDLANEQGDPVAAGVYLFTIESSGQTKRGKLAILR